MYTLQGDVFGMIDESNTFVVWYRYDAWGNILGVGGSMGGTLGMLQPFRYRGYVWDEETGLYYLRSRYLNPRLGRFVSADEIIKGNLYTYCHNDPVQNIDVDGHNAQSGTIEEFVKKVKELIDIELLLPNEDW